MTDSEIEEQYLLSSMLMAARGSEQREVTRELTQSMRVPKKYWPVSPDRLPNQFPYTAIVRDFAQNVVQYVLDGRGLILHGPYGSGKTSCGVILLKALAARSGLGLMVTAEEIPSAQFSKDSDLHGRMRAAGLLLIDDLRREYAKDFGISSIESLLRYRCDHERSTIITTNASLRELDERYEAAMQAFREKGTPVQVAGKDWRKKLASR